MIRRRLLSLVRRARRALDAIDPVPLPPQTVVRMQIVCGEDKGVPIYAPFFVGQSRVVELGVPLSWDPRTSGAGINVSCKGSFVLDWFEVNGIRARARITCLTAAEAVFEGFLPAAAGS